MGFFERDLPPVFAGSGVALISNNGEEPGAKLFGLPKLGKALECCEEGLLGGILRGRVIVRAATSIALDGGVVAINEGREVLAVPGANTLDESCV